MKSDQILFDTDDIQVRYVAHADTLHPDVCFVTFSPRQAAGISTGFGEGLFTARRINAFHFISKWNHWWQTDDFATAAAVVDAFLKDGDCKRLVAYGSSMGGTGALLASQHLPVTETLVFCPQYSMDPAIVPDEVRWKALVPLITFGPDMMPFIRPAGPTYVLSDPLFAPDQKHVHRTRACRPIHFIPVAFSNHHVPKVVKQYGLLQWAILSLLEAPLDPVALRHRIREARRLSADYWAGMGVYALRHRKIERAAFAASKALALLADPVEPKRDLDALKFLHAYFQTVGDGEKAEHYATAIEHARRPASPTGPAG